MAGYFIGVGARGLAHAVYFYFPPVSFSLREQLQLRSDIPDRHVAQLHVRGRVVLAVLLPRLDQQRVQGQGDKMNEVYY